MNGKPCSFCGVGWMVLLRCLGDDGRWWHVWYCDACGHEEWEAE